MTTQTDPAVTSRIAQIEQQMSSGRITVRDLEHAYIEFTRQIDSASTPDGYDATTATIAALATLEAADSVLRQHGVDPATLKAPSCGSCGRQISRSLGLSGLCQDCFDRE